MPLRVDSERNEIRALKEATMWHGRRVLEVGCGDGRLTRRLAGLGAHVEAIDPNASVIRAARRSMPPSVGPRVRFRVGGAERLAYPSESFDVVVYSWVL